MEKLSSQDAGFLKIESAHCPFHVAGLLILKLPANASRDYLRQLVRKCGRLNELWPVFSKKLQNPENLADAAWVAADDYHPERHVFHYSLPRPGRMEDLLALVTRAHERPLDRSRPLWEVHVIEGLGRGRFALYCKVHHSLVDGVGAMRMIQSLLTTSPKKKLDFNKVHPEIEKHDGHHSLFATLGDLTRGLLNQYKALPELSRLLAHMGADALQGKKDVMRLPFTAPRTIFNTQLDSRRALIVGDLPLTGVKRLARQAGGSVNDVLIAVCGGALRRYLSTLDALPKTSLVAGMPVSLKSPGDEAGNKLSYIMSPFFTDEGDDLRRLQRVIKVTRAAKAELGHMSTTAAQDYYALIMAPTILLTVTGNATRVRPATNAILSNVPGSKEKLYLEGAELEYLYPLSIVTDGMGLNITVVSHANKLCIAIISCPTDQPGVEGLGKLLKASYRDLQAAVLAA
ncbi:MAG: wax ester/triacylglycerol synthase family O-acyltransferase [Gammaproteobacteria bacterium]|jgi:diacylglycerol O-acyltransferase|nr:wax ester/triacylglycerol synthase family O-acyltransferase [Gammaproteobacteria bacterium]